MDKPKLRKIAKERIRTISRKDESSGIIRQILTLPEYREAETVLGFIPLPDEPDITPLIECDTRILLPYIEGDAMHFSASRNFIKGKFTWEPEHIEKTFESALMLVPLLGYSSTLQRLGRGGGFYDRYLAEHKDGIITAGAAFSVSYLEEYRAESYDAALDMIITPSAVVRRAAF